MNTVTLKKSQYQYNSLLEYFNSAQSAVLLIQEFMIQIIIDCVFASECEIMDNLKAAVYEYCIVKAVLNNILPADMNIFDQQYSYHISCYIFIFWYFDLKI